MTQMVNSETRLGGSAENIYESRRYSAVLLHHPSLVTQRGLQELLGRKYRDWHSLASLTGLPLSRVSYFAEKSYFPKRARRQTITPPGKDTPHDIYIGWLDIRASKKTYRAMLLASPYIRLLEQLQSELSQALNAPSPRFFRPAMPRLFDRLEASNFKEFQATRISLKIESEAELEIVSLTGKNPLRSDLRKRMADIASPYAIRLRTDCGMGATNLHIDRHGNYWWHLADENYLSNCLITLQTLADEQLFVTGWDSPLIRRYEDV